MLLLFEDFLEYSDIPEGELWPYLEGPGSSWRLDKPGGWLQIQAGNYSTRGVIGASSLVTASHRPALSVQLQSLQDRVQMIFCGFSDGATTGWHFGIRRDDGGTSVGNWVGYTRYGTVDTSIDLGVPGTKIPVRLDIMLDPA